MTRAEIRRKANDIMENRRLRAVLESEKRQEEIYKKLPQVAEARRMLAESAAELSRAIVRRDGSFKDNFEKIRMNNLECSRMIKDILRSNGYPEDHLEPHYRCSECNDTGFLTDSMCGCMKRLINQLACEELNRTANMPDSDFEHFSLDYYKGITIDGVDCYGRMSKNLDFCKKYAASFSRGSKSILMLGKTGIGKTHLSMAIAREVTQNGFNAVYGSVVNLLRSIENEHFGRAEGGSDTLETLFGCDLLVLDDLGAEHHTAFYEATLYNIVNTRINSALPTIISANLPLDELYATYNERIISRIAGCYEILYCEGKDIRQLKRLGG